MSQPPDDNNPDNDDALQREINEHLARAAQLQAQLRQRRADGNDSNNSAPSLPVPAAPVPNAPANGQPTGISAADLAAFDAAADAAFAHFIREQEQQLLRNQQHQPQHQQQQPPAPPAAPQAPPNNNAVPPVAPNALVPQVPAAPAAQVAAKARGRPPRAPPAGQPINARMGTLRIDVPRYANGQPVSSSAWVFVYRGGGLRENLDDDNEPENGNGGPPPFSYIALQGEVGAQGGDHWQGYIEFENRYSADQIRAMMNTFGWDSSHLYLRPRWGTQEQAIKYCKKDDTRDPNPRKQFRELGVKHAPSAAQAPGAVEAAIIGGMNEEDVMKAFPTYYMKHSAGISRMCARLQQPPRWRKVEVHILWGPTGTWKSRTALDICEKETGDLPYVRRLSSGVSVTDLNLYKGQTHYVWDEFNPYKYPLDELLPDTDGNPLTRNQKYGSVHVQWTTMFITTNIDPAIWYRDANPEHLGAWRRRCPPSNWHHFKTASETTMPPEARRFLEWWPKRKNAEDAIKVLMSDKRERDTRVPVPVTTTA